MKRKTIPASRVTVKDATTGTFEAVFATLDVIDHDGDVITKGAIDDGAKVVISSYGHGIWKGEMPVGTGTISEVGDELIVDGRFFLKSTAGADTFITVSELADEGQGEWSFGLLDVEAERGTKDGTRVNFITKVRVPEVSPVFMGAGINTRTLATKGRKQLNSDVVEQLRDMGRERWGDNGTYVYPEDYDVDAGYVIFSIYSDTDPERLVRVEFSTDGDTITLSSDESDVERDVVYAPKSGHKFSEQADAVMAAVDELTTRAEEVVTLRAAKGKTIGDESAGLLTKVSDQLTRLKTLLDDPPVVEIDDGTPTPEDIEAINAFAAEMVRFDVEISQGVTS